MIWLCLYLYFMGVISIYVVDTLASGYPLNWSFLDTLSLWTWPVSIPLILVYIAIRG